MAITLEKGQRISLTKEAPGGLSNVFLGLGWGRRKSKGLFGFGAREEDVDLDASCLLFDDSGELVDQVWFRQLRSTCGSIRHSGDDRSGGGSVNDDNERIQVDLVKLPRHVKTLVFTVNSFLGQTFEGIPTAFCRLVDAGPNREIARFDLSLEGGRYTGLVMVKVYRDADEWKMQALGEWGSGRTFNDLLPVIKPLL